MKVTWSNLFSDLQNDIEDLIQNLNDKDIHVCPDMNNIFKCFTYFDVLETKVVIVGQDPYHTKNTATGLSFQSNTEKNPPSLKNIYKAIRHFYPNALCNIDLWANQGVLMLNRALTVELNKPNSHTKLWKPITNRMIELLCEYMKTHEKKLVFMLWGNNAKELMSFIDKDYHIVLTHTHPSPLARQSFNTCDHFMKCNQTYNIHW